MIPLTLDLETSAALLGFPTEALLQTLHKGEIEGIRLDDQWRLSVFVLAKLLSTSPETLLDYLEDEVLAEKIAEVEGDEFFEPGEGRQVYQSYLAEDS